MDNFVMFVKFVKQTGQRTQVAPFMNAVVAIGCSILETAYHLFNRATTHQELGAHHFDAQHSERLKRHSLVLLQHLGYRVTLVLAPA